MLEKVGPAVLLRGAHPSYLAYAAVLLAVAAFARVACAALLNDFVYRITGMPAIKLALLLIPYELLAEVVHARVRPDGRWHCGCTLVWKLAEEELRFLLK